MDIIQALVIAILQGATELFPVSSLGHAVVLPALLHWGIDQKSPEFLPFLVMLHLGTATALLGYFWQDWWASYEELRVEREEILDLGNGVTFSVVNQKARLVGTSTEIRHRNAVVTVWVDGLAVLMRFFSGSSNADVDEARAAAKRLAEERG